MCPNDEERLLQELLQTLYSRLDPFLRLSFMHQNFFSQRLQLRSEAVQRVNAALEEGQVREEITGSSGSAAVMSAEQVSPPGLVGLRRFWPPKGKVCAAVRTSVFLTQMLRSSRILAPVMVLGSSEGFLALSVRMMAV